MDVTGTDEQSPAGEQPYHSTAERRHVDALLDVSEEDFLKELEPHAYHCYSGWEEAVRGWARVAPLSCILLTQKRYRKVKHKEADNQTSFVDPTLPNADGSASIAEHLCESHAGPSSSFKKSTLLNQQMGYWHDTALAALQLDASEWTVLNGRPKNTSRLFIEEKTEDKKALRETPLQPHHLSLECPVSECRPAKPQKHGHENKAVVPIKNFTFLPPIKSPYLNPKFGGQLCSGKASEEEALDESSFMFDKKSETRGTGVDPVATTEFPTYSAGLTSRYWTCQRNLELFSAVSVSVPKRYRVPLSSKPDTVHHTSYSLSKRLTPALHSRTAVGAQAHMHPSCLS